MRRIALAVLVCTLPHWVTSAETPTLDMVRTSLESAWKPVEFFTADATMDFVFAAGNAAGNMVSLPWYRYHASASLSMSGRTGPRAGGVAPAPHVAPDGMGVMLGTRVRLFGGPQLTRAGTLRREVLADPG